MAVNLHVLLGGDGSPEAYAGAVHIADALHLFTKVHTKKG